MRGAGAGAGFGRAGRLVWAGREQGDVAYDQGAFGGGEPGRESYRDCGRDGCRCGLHRRFGGDPFRGHVSVVRRGVCGDHVGAVPARVHLRPFPPVGVGVACAPGRADRADRVSARHRRALFRGHRFAASPGVRPRASRAPVTGTPRSPRSRCYGWACPRWRPRSAPSARPR